MRRVHTLLFVVGILALMAAGVVTVRIRQRGQATHEQAIYYCQMHPGMVSDRPGECPICHMNLIKQETSPGAPAQSSAQQMIPPPGASPSATSRPLAERAAARLAPGGGMKDVCYMHNCPMVKPGQQCPMLVVAKAGEKVTCPICGTHVAETATSSAQQKKILYWTDPMIPGYKSEKPGKSPMGMDMVPVYEENGTGMAQATAPPGYAPILVSPQKRQFIGVKSAPVQSRKMTKTIRTVGLIAHDPELYQTQQEFIQALRAFTQAQASQIPEVTERAKRLVESTRLRLRHLGLNERLIEEVGTWTEPDHRLLIGGAGQYWVYASIYEYELPLVHEGQPVTIEVNTLQGRTFSGTVKAIDPILDHMTRTVRVRVIVEDPEGLLKPEMYVNVLIATDLGQVLALPEEAVFATGTKNIVFVDKGQGLFEPRDVAVGAKADGYYEVQAGVNAGETVVTSGNFLIDSESRLKAALEGMSGGEHQHDSP